MGNAAGSTSQVDIATEADRHQESHVTLSESLQEALAKKLHVSKTEVMLLYERFVQFGPNSKGLVDKSVFEQPPYSSDPFCRQIWMRIAEQKGNPNMFSFVSFAKTLAWWHNAPSKTKAEMLFSWITSDSDLTPVGLAQILAHIEPKLTEDELLIMAERALQLTAKRGGSNRSTNVSSVTSASFLKWCERIPKEKLDNALEFRLS